MALELSVESLTDRSGQKHVLQKADDLYVPYCVGRFKNVESFYMNFGNVSNLHIRDDDVFILGYQRSGTHWIYEMIGMLLKGKTETMDRTKEGLMLDIVPIEKLETLPSPRLLNCHFWPKHVPRNILIRKNVIYLLRNPKDVAVSSFHFLRSFKSATHLGLKPYDGKFEDYLEWLLEGKVEFGSWFEYVRAWEKVFETDSEIDPIIVHYEDMKRDTLPVLRRIADRIGDSYSDEFLKEVITACEFNKMREDNEQRNDGTKTITVDGRSPMYRKGTVGDWKYHFTAETIEKFDAVYKEKMDGSKLKFVYE